jgi:hypothetical protein
MNTAAPNQENLMTSESKPTIHYVGDAAIVAGRAFLVKTKNTIYEPEPGRPWSLSVAG